MLHKDTINISISHYILLVTHDKIPYSCECPHGRATRKLSNKAIVSHDATTRRQTKKKSLTLTDEAPSVLFKKMMCIKVGPIGFEPMTLCL